MRLNNIYSFSILFFICVSCTQNKEDGADKYLNLAREAYKNKEFILSKKYLDSLNTLYPKSFEQRREAIILLDSIRRSENKEIIAICDSLILIYKTKIKKLKENFNYQKDPKYQESGFYTFKDSDNGENSTKLRAGVFENGYFYIESVYVGSKQKHNKVKITAKDGTSAETLPVTDDGTNFSFSHLGIFHEIIRFMKNSENGITKFIVLNKNKSLSVSLLGEKNYSYQLTNKMQASIIQASNLSDIMIMLDSLNQEKEKAEYRIYYLNNEKIKISPK